MPNFEIDPLLAVAVMFATACTDAVYVLFTNAVIKRRRLPAASWSSIWNTLTGNWMSIIKNWRQPMKTRKKK